MALQALTAGTVALADGASDVRGWSVRTLVDDCAVATVHDLLLDAAGSVRWIDLALERGTHVLLPAGQARADPDRQRIWVPGLESKQLPRLPRYDHLPSLVDEAREEVLLGAYAAVLLRERVPPPPPPEPAGNVVPLAALPDFRVAEGDQDPRGWAVVGAGSTPLCEVEELMVDPHVLRVRHLVCRIPGADERRVLLPVGYARLEPDERLVRVPRLTREALDALPAWHEPSEARAATDAAAARLGAPHDPADDPRLDARALFSVQPRVRERGARVTAGGEPA